MAQRMAKRTRPLIVTICLLLCLMVIAGIAVVIWKKTSDDDSHERKVLIDDQNFSLTIGSQNVSLEITQDGSSSTLQDPASLVISLATNLSTSCLKSDNHWSSDGAVSLLWPNGTSVHVRKIRDDPLLSCLAVNWTMSSSARETAVDCIDMSNSFWFGGFQESFQHWPINKLVIPMAPFVTGDAYSRRKIGDVINPLLVSSLGIGIYVEETVPLYISFNHHMPGHLCLQGRTTTASPFFQSGDKVFLNYALCRSTNVTQVWKEMARLFHAKPSDIPSPLVFRNPIWSTWAMYKRNINQTTTLQYADDILDHGFGISQLEIDDDWTPKYGDFTFDLDKFPDARAMISNLTDKGIPVTVWIHPFFNNDSHAFQELHRAGYLVKESKGNDPALTAWWRGYPAGILDVTNPQASKWYLRRLASLKLKFNVTSFKFDAGEVNWLPTEYKLYRNIATPNEYSRAFAKMAFLSDLEQRRQEVRVGFLTQDLPIFVRMIDRDSNWGHERGLKSLIPTALTFSIMGYPFILPDMIGGNAYDPNSLDITVLPDAELFIRWLQISTFMPTLQFSVAPWLYNDSVLEISRKYVELHSNFSDKIVALARESTISGDPIVRPLWWIAPDDPVSLTLDTEYMLGDEILIAPVLEKGATSRDVYLPRGSWKHCSTGVIHSGPLWLRDLPAPLHELPYFTKESE